MTSGPVYALVLAKQNAIKEWRSLMGPTNSNTARTEKPKRYSILEQLQIMLQKVGLQTFSCRQELYVSLYSLLFDHVLVFAVEIAVLGNKVYIYSLRALYGTDGTQNATHGSDSPASAAREIRFFFPQLTQVDMPYHCGISAYPRMPDEILKFATSTSQGTFARESASSPARASC